MPLRGHIKGTACCFPEGDSSIEKKNTVYFQPM